MIINLARIREKGEPYRVRLSLSGDQLALQEELVTLSEPVESDLEVRVSGEQVEVRGKVKATLSVSCVRCLNTFDQIVDKSFLADYRPDPELEDDSEEFELAYSDLDIGFYRGDEIDLAAVLSEQIVLEIPMKPICRSECRGLCDRCGADLNAGDCGCKTESIDPRLESLRSLKDRLIH